MLEIGQVWSAGRPCWTREGARYGRVSSREREKGFCRWHEEGGCVANFPRSTKHIRRDDLGDTLDRGYILVNIFVVRVPSHDWSYVTLLKTYSGFLREPQSLVACLCIQEHQEDYIWNRLHSCLSLCLRILSHGYPSTVAAAICPRLSGQCRTAVASAQRETAGFSKIYVQNCLVIENTNEESSPLN